MIEERWKNAEIFEYGHGDAVNLIIWSVETPSSMQWHTQVYDKIMKIDQNYGVNITIKSFSPITIFNMSYPQGTVYQHEDS